MLFRSMLARDCYPDILAGVYDPDEIHVPAQQRSSSTSSAPVEVIEDAEIVTSTPDSDVPEFALIESATSAQELMGLLKQLQALTGHVKKTAREKYAAKMKTFEEQPAAPVEAAS